MLHAVNAKLIRRLRKFELSTQGACLQPGWTETIQTSVLDAHKIMHDHWQGLLKDTGANIDTSVLPLLHPKDDLNIPLPELDTFITKIASRQDGAPSASFQAGHSRPNIPPTELPNCPSVSGEYMYFSLMALESWVEQNLQSWVTQHLQDDDTCGKLRRLIESYYAKARGVYTGMPDHISIMYLTLIELWIACDMSRMQYLPTTARIRSRDLPI